MKNEGVIRRVVQTIKRNTRLNSASTVQAIRVSLTDEFDEDELTDEIIMAARDMMGWTTQSAGAPLPRSIGTATPIPSPKAVSTPDSKESVRPKAYPSPDTRQNRKVRPLTPPAPSAPFRFVKLHDRIAMPAPLDTPSKRADRNLPIRDGYRARIHVEWIVETPLLIGSEVKEQVPNGPDVSRVQPLTLGASVKANGFANQNYIIPGATLKGLIRSACVTIAHGRVGAQVNRHRIFPLRDFNHPVYSEHLVDANKVRAGLLRKSLDENGRELWRLTPMMQWRCVEIADIIKHFPNAGFSSSGQWLVSDLVDKYNVCYNINEKVIEFKFIGGGFSQGQVSIGQGRFRKTATFGGADQGVLVFAGAFTSQTGTKRYEYVFFPDPNRQSRSSIALSPDEIASFIALHTKPGELNDDPVGSWKELKPTFDANKPIPVFYIGTPGQPGFHFGLTRLFKIPHAFSVGDVLKNSHPAHLPPSRVVGDKVVHEPDFVEELFGYVVDAKDVEERGADHRMMPTAAARKGRAAFSMARLKPNQNPVIARDDTVVVMMAPRESFAPFYLGGKPELEKDYSSDPARFAGPKRYIPRQKPANETDRRVVTTTTIGDLGRRQIQQIQQASNGGPVSEEVKSRLRFLTGPNGRELVFESMIELHNVTAAEVGAILFAVTHGGDPTKPYRHMLGRAKAFGAGQTRVGAVRLEIESNVPAIGDALVRPPMANERLAKEGQVGFVPPSANGAPVAENASHIPFLDAFETAMRQAVGEPRFPEVDVVQEHLGAATPGTKTTAQLHYMPLSDFSSLRTSVNLRQPGKGEGGNKLPASLYPEQTQDDGRILPAPKTKRAVRGTKTTG